MVRIVNGQSFLWVLITIVYFSYSFICFVVVVCFWFFLCFCFLLFYFFVCLFVCYSFSSMFLLTQILYNRALVQLGMCAFRHGMIKDAHDALVDIQSSGRSKELLAQVY